MRRSSAIRATAWAVVAAGFAAPLVRKRVSAPPIVTQAVACAAPLGLCVAMRRSRTRDLATCALQMWAYLAAYKAPHDDPVALEGRVHLDYPIAIDQLLGLGELPSLRLQHALAGGLGPDSKREWRKLDRVLVWAHWVWFMVPHGSLVYILVRRPERFPRAAVMTYAVFDLGASVYWVAPTAPPWYVGSGAAREMNGGSEAARDVNGGSVAVRDIKGGSAATRGADGGPAVRRMMVEYGESFWRDGWMPLYSVFGGNPLAAMPSLHFATSVMAALLLAETGPLAGVLGWGYAGVLGFALVYLGEHYVVDLIAGAALTGAVRRLGPRAGGALTSVRSAVAALEAIAHEAA